MRDLAAHDRGPRKQRGQNPSSPARARGMKRITTYIKSRNNQRGDDHAGGAVDHR
jgi:hypothetical protein